LSQNDLVGIIYLHETYSQEHIGSYTSGAFYIQNDF